MQVINELEEVKAGFNEKVVIYPKLITAAEEDAFAEDFANLADGDLDKEKKQFEIMRQFLIDVSATMPDVLVTEKGKAVKKPLVENAETIADAIQKYFAEFNTANYRVATALYWGCKARFQPTANF